MILKTRDTTKRQGHYKMQEGTNIFETQQTFGQQEGESKGWDVQEICLGHRSWHYKTLGHNFITSANRNKPAG